MVFKILRWVPSIIVMGVIFAFSSVPGNQLPTFRFADYLFKHLGHMFEFGLLSIALVFGRNEYSRKAKFSSLLFVLIYAFSDEFHQSFVPFRSPSFMDIGFDLAGAGIALYIIVDKVKPYLFREL